MLASTCCLAGRSPGEDPDSLLAGAEELYDRSGYREAALLYRRAAGSFFRQERWSPYARCLLQLADHQRIMGQNARAGDILDSAGQCLERHFEQGSEPWADYHYVRGKISASLGDYARAMEDLRASVRIRQETSGDRRKLSRTYNYMGIVHYMAGDYRRAREQYNRALGIISRHREGPCVEKARFYHNMALIDNIEGNYESYLRNERKNIRMTIRLFGEDYAYLYAPYITMGHAYTLMNRFDSARLFLDRAERILTENYGKDYIKLHLVYSNKAILMANTGEYSRALDYYRKSLSILLGHYPENHPEVLRVHNNIGVLHLKRKEFDRAIGHFSRSLELRGEMHPSYLLKTHQYLASAYSSAGRSPEADRHFSRLLRGIRTYHGGESLPMANALVQYGGHMLRMEEEEKALASFREALRIRKEHYGREGHMVADAFYNLGYALLHFARARQAVPCFDSALAALDFPVPRHREDLNGTSGNGEGTFLIDLVKGRAGAAGMIAARSAGQDDSLRWLEESLAGWLAATGLLENVRMDYLTEESKLYLSENEKDCYRNSILSALALYGMTGDPEYRPLVFRQVEKSRYALLLESLRSAEAMEFSGVPGSVLRQEHDLRRNISAYRELIRSELRAEVPDTDKTARWQNRVFVSQEKLEGLISGIRRKYPGFYNLKYGREVTSPGEIGRLLDEDELILEYYLADTLLTVFRIGRREVEMFSASADSLFYRDINTVCGFASGYHPLGYGSEEAVSFSEASYRLFRTLTGGAGIPYRHRVVVIPGGKLSYLPFEVLCTEPGDYASREMAYWPLVVREYPVSYAYSGTIWAGQQGKKRVRGNRLLAFAPEYTGMTDNEIRGPASRAIRLIRDSLPVLEGISSEVREIGKITTCRMQLGKEASEHRFKELAPSYQLFHLAMHAFIDDRDPMYSKLVFSENYAGNEDGLLNAYEIYNLNMQARMVVLSACNTGMGKISAGEGVMSLARAFSYAGCPSVIMTLWPVGDRSGRDLMVDYYRYLKKGMAKDEAMRRAKLNRMEAGDRFLQHPYFWAGYMVIGDRSPVYVHATLRKLIAGMLLAVILAGSFAAYRRKRKRKRA